MIHMRYVQIEALQERPEPKRIIYADEAAHVMVFIE